MWSAIFSWFKSTFNITDIVIILLLSVISVMAVNQANLAQKRDNAKTAFTLLKAENDAQVTKFSGQISALEAQIQNERNDNETKQQIDLGIQRLSGFQTCPVAPVVVGVINQLR